MVPRGRRRRGGGLPGGLAHGPRWAGDRAILGLAASEGAGGGVAGSVGGGSGVPGGGGDYDFFVSYTGVDAGWAEWIAWQLEGRVRFGDRDARVFVQAWDLVPGTNWASGMHLALPASARVVPVLSPAYLADSRDGNAEWLAVWPDDTDGLRRRVVPVRVRESRPGGLLRSITYIDLVGRDEALAATALLSGIMASVEGRAKPTLAPTFPGPGGRAAGGGGRPSFPGRVSAAAGRSSTGSGAGEEGESGEPAVTVLHISDTQFGAHHVFGKAGLTEADRAQSSLFRRLQDDLADRAEIEGLRPDLVVVTGDLAETGEESEFDQAYDFLVALAETLGLD